MLDKYQVLYIYKINLKLTKLNTRFNKAQFRGIKLIVKKKPIAKVNYINIQERLVYKINKK